MQQKQNYRNFASRIAGYVSNIKKPRCFVKFLIALFGLIYRIKLDEYIVPIGGFVSFNDFFTRKIKTQYRPLSDAKIVSPVDGKIVDYGIIDNEKKIFVKHNFYYLEDLISDYHNLNYNSYIIIYLSPRNYHRVHTPFSCKINTVDYFPGTLFSVRNKTVMKRDNVFCRNERIVINGSSENGNFCLVMVGAMIVGKIKLSFDDEIQTNIKKGSRIQKYYKPEIIIEKGEELGLFELGSTVILLMSDNSLNNVVKLKNSEVKVGEAIV